MPNPAELNITSHEPVEVFLLPEWFAGSTQQFVGVAGCRPFHLTNQIGERHVRRPEHVHVIGHDHVSMQATEAASNHVPQLIRYQTCDLRLREVSWPVLSRVEKPVPCGESLSRSEVFRKEDAFPWQASRQTPRDKRGYAEDVQMGQSAAMACHSFFWCVEIAGALITAGLKPRAG